MIRRPIHPLPDTVIAVIAAGEVIERPATIVKELVENALDAGATEIQITLEDGGKQRLFIQDNGYGIPREELPIAVQKHTTNKIEQYSDLDFLQSYGFRGEALSSIATVSKLTVRSRTHQEDMGTELVVMHGKVSQPTSIGMSIGTQVLVEQLFAKLPARRKFLKSALHERKAILDTITQLSIAATNVAFTVTEQEKTLFYVPAEQSLVERLTYLFGEEFSQQLWPFQYQDTLLKVHGVLGSPQLARRGKPTQHVIVNRRPVSLPSLGTVVREAYGSSVEPKAAPSFILFLDIDPAQIDVNVHPRKETLQWQDESAVFQQLRTALGQHFQVQYQPPSNSPPLKVHDSGRQTLPELHSTLKSSAPTWYHALATKERTILQVHNTYLISETAEGLIIVDQHAAHERVLYNQFLELFHQQLQDRTVAELQPPMVIHLSPSFSNLLTANLETFTAIGCQIEPFGDQSFLIRTLPELLKEHHPQNVIESVLEDIANDVPLNGIDQLAHRTLAYLACRSAVKAGDPITQDQAQVLLEKLQHTSYAFSCPHGRPTIQTFSWHEVEKWFKRK